MQYSLHRWANYDNHMFLRESASMHECEISFDAAGPRQSSGFPALRPFPLGQLQFWILWSSSATWPSQDHLSVVLNYAWNNISRFPLLCWMFAWQSVCLWFTYKICYTKSKSDKIMDKRLAWFCFISHTARSSGKASLTCVAASAGKSFVLLASCCPSSPWHAKPPSGIQRNQGSRWSTAVLGGHLLRIEVCKVQCEFVTRGQGRDILRRMGNGKISP